MAASVQQQEMIIKEFKKFDRNGDGSIEVAELASVLKRLNGETFTEENVQSIFLEMDANLDGKVSVKEFLAWVWGGSAEVLQFSLQALGKHLATLKELTEKFSSDESAMFWAWMPRAFGEDRHYKKWDQEHTKDYAHLLQVEFRSGPADDALSNEEIPAQCTEAEVNKRKRCDFLLYLQTYLTAAGNGNEVMTPISFSEYEKGWAGVDSLCARTEDLMRFMEKGGFLPKAFEAELLGRRSLVEAWKSKASSFAEGFLITKERPGQEREAVYKLLRADLRQAHVGKLHGVKWQPALMATSDNAGGWTLPLNEAQRVFDLIKPAQLAACGVDVANLLESYNKVLQNPVPRKDGWHTSTSKEEAA